jgi:hypothetical protein
MPAYPTLNVKREGFDTIYRVASDYLNCFSFAASLRTEVIGLPWNQCPV